MTKKQKSEIASIIDNEGFDYTFVHYSSFKEVKDKKFHELIEKFLSARKDLGDYLELELT